MPPLGQIDDQLIIADCGLDSALASAHVNAQTNVKTLQFGAEKCVKMHVGADKKICPQNLIDTWKLEGTKEKVSFITDLEDTESEKHCMKTIDSWTYLGDVLESNGKNDKNIQNRVQRGAGAMKQVIQMLEELTLGDFYFEGAMILRASLFLSSLISNSEAWVNLTKKNVTDLEKVDENLLRKILSAHPKTPTELLYLELGAIPVRFTLMSRRINYLWYLIHDKEGSLLKTFFEAQCDQPVRGDWVSTVKQDLADLNIQMTFEEIADIQKEAFKKLVKENVQKAALEYLKKLQMTHSKSQNLHYDSLNLQGYLKSGTSNMTIKEKLFCFAARSRMVDVRCNKLNGQIHLKCRLGCDVNETQNHLLDCDALSDSNIVKKIPEYADLLGTDVKKMETVSKILQAKFKLLKELHEQHQVNGSLQSCSALNTNVIVPHVPNVSIDDLD